MISVSNGSTKNSKDKDLSLKNHIVCNSKFLKLRHLITSQLVASSPASLPIYIIVNGLRCASEHYTEQEITSALEHLTKEGTVVEINECGLYNRYQLSERSSTQAREDNR